MRTIRFGVCVVLLRIRQFPGVRCGNSLSVILTHDPIENENENARSATTDDDGERDR